MPKLFVTTRLFGNTVANYPDLSITDPALKNAEYIAQYGQAHLAAYQSSGKLEWWGNTEASDRLAYAQGRQDPMKYRRIRKENERLDKIGSRLDLRILKVVPKYVKTISGLLDQAEYFASADAIDGLAEDMKAAHEGGLRAQMESGDKLAQVGINMSPDGQPAPMDEDEIQLRMLQYKNDEALRMEADMQKANYDGNMPQVMRECNMYNAIFGRSCIFNYRTKDSIIPQALEPWRAFLLPSRKEDFSDLQAGAHLDEISIGQLRMEAGDEISENEYAELASSGRMSMNRTWTDLTAAGGTVRDAQNSILVRVVRFGFKSFNIDENGRYWAWYEGVLIVESQQYYGCRMAYNQLYDMNNPGAVLPPYIPIIPDQIAGYAVSVVDEVMAPADFVQRQWIMLQDTLNRTVPKGYAFDMDKIEDIVLAEGKKLTKDEIVETFLRTGNWLHNGVAMDGTKDGNVGVRELVNGISADVEALFGLIREGVDLIERMTGINSAVAAGNAEKRVAVGALDAAKAGAANALQFLFAAQKSLFERACRHMACHFRQLDIMQRGLDVGYGKHRFRLMVEQLPTQDEKDKFAETLRAALDAGAIDYQDIVLIQTVKNPRLGRIVLGARAKRKQADALAAKQADADNAMKMQAQGNADALKEKMMLADQQNKFELAKQKEAKELDAKLQVMLANIKADADKQIEYYRARASAHNEHLANAWRATTAMLPKPNGTEGGATEAATRAAVLEALTPSMTPDPELLAPPTPMPMEPEPDPNEQALQQLMGGQPAPAEGMPAEGMPAEGMPAEQQMMPMQQ